MHIGTKNGNYEYQMKNNGTLDTLKITTLERHLGVYVSSNLKWHNQVQVVVSKANSKLGMLAKAFTYKDKELIKQLYCTFVRPLLEFAAPVWCPYLEKDMNALERVQQRATKMIPELRHFSYEDRLIRLKLILSNSLKFKTRWTKLTDKIQILLPYLSRQVVQPLTYEGTSLELTRNLIAIRQGTIFFLTESLNIGIS